jgi:hypothetical protein
MLIFSSQVYHVKPCDLNPDVEIPQQPATIQFGKRKENDIEREVRGNEEDVRGIRLLKLLLVQLSWCAIPEANGLMAARLVAAPYMKKGVKGFNHQDDSFHNDSFQDDSFQDNNFQDDSFEDSPICALFCRKSCSCVSPSGIFNVQSKNSTSQAPGLDIFGEFYNVAMKLNVIVFRGERHPEIVGVQFNAVRR